MPPTLYLVRHAQGVHNLEKRHDVRDPSITSLGVQQCQKLRESFPFHDKVSLVMASPLQRTIQTAFLGFYPALRRTGVPLLLVPMAQEISGFPCDVGLDRADLEKLIPTIMPQNVHVPSVAINEIDFSLLEDGWNSKTGVYESSYSAFEKRAAALRSWLWQRPESDIVLVTHGAFLHFLIEDWSFFDHNKGTAFENCEFKIFKFTNDSNEQEAHLFEPGRGGTKICRPANLYPGVINEDKVLEKI